MIVPITLSIIFITIFLTIIMEMAYEMALERGDAFWHLDMIRIFLQRKQVLKNQIIAYTFNKYATGYLSLPGN